MYLKTIHIQNQLTNTRYHNRSTTRFTRCESSRAVHTRALREINSADGRIPRAESDDKTPASDSFVATIDQHRVVIVFNTSL